MRRCTDAETRKALPNTARSTLRPRGLHEVEEIQRSVWELTGTERGKVNQQVGRMKQVAAFRSAGKCIMNTKLTLTTNRDGRNFNMFADITCQALHTKSEASKVLEGVSVRVENFGADARGTAQQTSGEDKLVALRPMRRRQRVESLARSHDRLVDWDYGSNLLR